MRIFIALSTIFICTEMALAKAQGLFPEYLPVTEQEAQAVAKEILGYPLANLDMNKVQKYAARGNSYVIRIKHDNSIKITPDKLCLKEELNLTWQSFNRRANGPRGGMSKSYSGAMPIEGENSCQHVRNWTSLQVERGNEVTVHQLLRLLPSVVGWMKSVSQEEFISAHVFPNDFDRRLRDSPEPSLAETKWNLFSTVRESAIGSLKFERSYAEGAPPWKAVAGFHFLSGGVMIDFFQGTDGLKIDSIFVSRYVI